jgi:hypothetical protein
VAISRYLESGKNITGCVCGLVGLGFTFTGLAGAYWPVVVAGLYGAGALIAPPKRPPLPDFPDPSAELAELREDFEKLDAYLAQAELPPAVAARVSALTTMFEALLAPGWVGDELAKDPDGVYELSRAVRQDLPEAVDHFVRTRWWTRMAPGSEPPERHLERQLTVLHEEAARLAARLQQAQEMRQEALTRYLEGRGRTTGPA